MPNPAQSYRNLIQHIKNQAKQHQRPAPLLLAVSKTHTPDEMRLVHQAGCHDFAENYLQEAQPKIQALTDLPIQWHFIGPLQSNKTRAIAEQFDWVHSVDTLRLAQRLNDQRPGNKPPLNICIQVNIDDETTKSGVPPDQVEALVEPILKMPRLTLRGLMCIPHPWETLEQQRRPLAALRRLLEVLQQKGYPLDTLSMGMSDDLEAAIVEGSTIVRIGTALFGQRPPKT